MVQVSGGSQIGYVADEAVPIIFVVDPKQASNPTYYVSGAYILGFKIQKKPNLGRISVDQIRVIVHRWKSLPEYEMRPAAFPTETSLYLATIRRPGNSGLTPFVAEHFYRATGNNQSEAQKFSPLVIDDDSPEQIHIRVNAEDVGDYLISIEIDVSHDLASDTVELLGPTRVLFVDQNEATPN